MSTKEQYPDLSVIEKQECICGWPTDTLSIDLNIDNRIIAAALVNSAKQFLKLDDLLVILEENRKLVPS